MDFEDIIIFEDRDILAVDKPVGIASEGGRIGQQDIESMARNYLSKKGEIPEVHMIHRLDQPVGGVLLMAKNKKAAANLSEQIQVGKIEKVYYAKVRGIPQGETGTLVDYLSRGPQNMTVVVKGPQKNAKKAVLDYELIEYDSGNDTSILKISLYTGRHHQIRVQLANAGMPIVGDRRYGEARNGDESLCLHSVEMKFIHPTDKSEIILKTFSVPFCAN